MEKITTVGEVLNALINYSHYRVVGVYILNRLYHKLLQAMTVLILSHVDAPKKYIRKRAVVITKE